MAKSRGTAFSIIDVGKYPMFAIYRLPSSLFRLVLELFLLTLAALFFLIGCATQGDQLETTPVGARENGMLVLTQNDNNRTAELQVGEQLHIRLPENPTTGFRWAVDENDRRILALDNTAYTPPAEAGFIGARGQRTFTFTGRQPGEVGLKLKYWRVLGGDGTITKRVGFTIRVIASPNT